MCVNQHNCDTPIFHLFHMEDYLQHLTLHGDSTYRACALALCWMKYYLLLKWFWSFFYICTHIKMYVILKSLLFLCLCMYYVQNAFWCTLLYHSLLETLEIILLSRWKGNSGIWKLVLFTDLKYKCLEYFCSDFPYCCFLKIIRKIWKNCVRKARCCQFLSL